MKAMKKTYFIIICIFCIVILQSSCASKKELSGSVEVEAATQGTKLIGQSPSYDPLGFQIGIIYPFPDFNEKFSFRPELNISMQGAKYEDDYSGYVTKGKVELWYANLPLVFRYQTEKGVFGEAGIQPGFLLSARDKYEGNNNNYRDYINFLDFGIPVGAGYQFNERLGLGVRVITGISNINKDSDVRDHNFVAALRVTYRLKK